MQSLPLGCAGVATLLERTVRCLASPDEDPNTFGLACSALRSLAASQDGAAHLLRAPSFLPEGRRYPGLLAPCLQGKMNNFHCQPLRELSTLREVTNTLRCLSLCLRFMFQQPSFVAQRGMVWAWPSYTAQHLNVLNTEGAGSNDLFSGQMEVVFNTCLRDKFNTL